MQIRPVEYIIIGNVDYPVKKEPKIKAVDSATESNKTKEWKA